MQTGETLKILKNIREDNHDPEDKLMVIHYRRKGEMENERD